MVTQDNPVRFSRLALLAIAALSGACSSHNSESGDQHSYTVRGKVDAPANAERVIYVRHEAVPGFINAFGEKSAMMSMSMGFAVPASIDTTNIAPGDKIQMTFHTDWKAKPALRIDSLEKLSPETELDLGR